MNDPIKRTNFDIHDSKTIRIQLSGPMSFMPDYNRKTFNKVTKELESKGYVVHNPAQYAMHVKTDADFDYGELLYKSLDFICHHASWIVLLPGFEGSKGAVAELATALACNVQAYRYVRIAGGDWQIEAIPDEKLKLQPLNI